MLKQIAVWFGIGGSLPLVVGAVAPPPADMWWVPFAVSFVGGAFAAGVRIGERVYTARKRARAAINRAEAERLLADGDPSNDAAARAMLLEAKLDEATADALDREIDKRETNKP